jgi:hypothetical protein
MLAFQADFAEGAAEIIDLHLGLSREGSSHVKRIRPGPGLISESSSDSRYSIQKRSKKVIN